MFRELMKRMSVWTEREKERETQEGQETLKGLREMVCKLMKGGTMGERGEVRKPEVRLPHEGHIVERSPCPTAERGADIDSRHSSAPGRGGSDAHSAPSAVHSERPALVMAAVEAMVLGATNNPNSRQTSAPGRGGSLASGVPPVASRAAAPVIEAPQIKVLETSVAAESHNLTDQSSSSPSCVPPCDALDPVSAHRRGSYSESISGAATDSWGCAITREGERSVDEDPQVVIVVKGEGELVVLVAIPVEALTHPDLRRIPLGSHDRTRRLNVSISEATETGLPAAVVKARLIPASAGILVCVLPPEGIS